MLTQLYIENLAVIEKADVDFGNKLNVFTGETGAGKSIIINGINAILGQRTSREIVRNNKKKAVVRAFFDNVPQSVVSKLSEDGIECDDEISIIREIHADGHSTAKINSVSVTTAFLKSVTQELIDIHGQHDSRILMQPETHITILDNFGNLFDELNEYRTVFYNLQSVARQLKSCSLNENERKRRANELKNQIAELEAAELQIGEEEELTEKMNFFRNSETVYKYLSLAVTALRGDSDCGECDNIDEINDTVQKLSDIFPAANNEIKRFEAVSVELRDLADEFENRLSELNFNAQEVDYTEERLSLIKKLKKKYSRTVEDLIVYIDECKNELEGITGNEEKLAGLAEKKKELLTTATMLARNLSEKRKTVSVKFSESVCNELQTLNMPNVKIGVKLEQGKLTLNGMDTAEFMISANKGEPLKPISKIASGGELSRIMLALKTVLADRDDIQTLIFDEIDTGISGIAARKVGEKLSEIANARQVICVTHLAQIASMADTHIKIEKSDSEGITSTNVQELDYNGRVNELARIISGSNITNATIKTAKEMLENK